MKYQLVLQFCGDSIQDYDALIELEERLIVALGSAHVVDGHDFGAGEMNIFVHSDDPEAAFAIAKTKIPAGTMARFLRAAYREIAGNHYSTIWPPDSTDAFEVK